MLSITENIKELRKIINEENFKLDEATEFLDAIFENAEALLQDNLNLTIDNDSKELAIEELESEALEDTITDQTMQCGIGTIEYKTPDNLLLEMVMENLDTAIQKHSALKVNESLSNLV